MPVAPGMLAVVTASDAIQTILAVITLGSLVVSIVSLRHSNSAKAESAEAILAAKRSADAAEGSRDELRRANDWAERQESEEKARATRKALRVDHLGANRYVLVNSGEATIAGITLHVAGFRPTISRTASPWLRANHTSSASRHRPPMPVCPSVLPGRDRSPLRRSPIAPLARRSASTRKCELPGPDNEQVDP